MLTSAHERPLQLQRNVWVALEEVPSEARAPLRLLLPPLWLVVPDPELWFATKALMRTCMPVAFATRAHTVTPIEAPKFLVKEST